MDAIEILFERTLTAGQHGQNEDEYIAAEQLAVTKESNGYAVWYGHSFPDRIIAWANRGNRNAAIAYAATVPAEIARAAFDRGVCTYDLK